MNAGGKATRLQRVVVADATTWDSRWMHGVKPLHEIISPTEGVRGNGEKRHGRVELSSNMSYVFQYYRNNPYFHASW